MPSVNDAECRKQAHYAECHYAECRYAECHGARIMTFIRATQVSVFLVLKAFN